jgi:DNA polymerase-3 subunit epsilon
MHVEPLERMLDATVREPMVFVDLETTGANFVRDRIIEVGLVEVDRDGVREWSALVDPGQPVSPFITELTGIDAAMLESAPSFAQLVPTLLQKLRGRLFVAHNARFDYGFLKHEFKRNGVDFCATNLCTVKLSRALFPQHHRHNLDTLAERYGVGTSDRHRALSDARLLWDLWRHWHALLPAEAIQEAVERIIGRPEPPPQFDPAQFDELPEAPGAYALFDKEGALLIAKRAANVRRQVFAHFSAQKRETPLARNASRIEWREAAGELGARLYELELTAAARPSVELCSWQLTRDDDFRPALVFARDLDFARAEDLYGLYRGQREAVSALHRLTKACTGEEAVSPHGAWLAAALARHRVRPWPYPGPIALVECDAFGMREEAHVIDAWGYLGTADDDAALRSLFASAAERRDAARFDADIYRIVGKSLKEGRLRVIAAPR